jgi:hypothetical protein
MVVALCRVCECRTQSTLRMTLVQFVLAPGSRTNGPAQAEGRAPLKSNSSADLGAEGEERWTSPAASPRLPLLALGTQQETSGAGGPQETRRAEGSLLQMYGIVEHALNHDVYPRLFSAMIQLFNQRESGEKVSP